MILDCIGSGNGLKPDGTKPLPEPMLTYHHWVNQNTSEGNSIPKLIPQPPVTKISLKITYSKLYQNLPETNELIYKWIIAHISHLCNKGYTYIYIADNYNQIYLYMISSRDVTCLYKRQ